MFRYTDLDPRKKAFVFELDNVLYPAQDYFFQVYYLFAAFVGHTEQWDSKAMITTMVDAYHEQGEEAVFETVQKKYSLETRYQENFKRLLNTAHVPLKLLLYQQMLDLLQQIVVDRKQIFILTNGNPQQQLNKIKHIEWNGLENYLVCYFADEIKPKPEPDALHHILSVHNLQRRDLMMIGNHTNDELCAQAAGVDYANLYDFIR
ncbi:HAD hydrolase-like protein [Mucilaginibacter sp. HMF7410]|uniref:HAD hydrolase-like protein n=1 Tax=Mucilaginibacter arboris TaxID=2682090 RepID=A0A7K1SU84_9SPHI|nr:HAD hydrolase-like protein [Mucilaginibacter arboris]